jgi:anaerobic dimethyl sulfoxide reductase subunit B (iron-sulfur subunit)
MTQYGFYIDLSRCIGCKACSASCKQWHHISPGPIRWMRVYQWETGAFPSTELHMLPIMCFHCEKPVCADACPNKAIYKESKYGAMLIDQSKCQGKRKCWKACPYGSPQFNGDESDLLMSKCNMCADRLDKGLKPICVLSCSMRALEFGPIDLLRQKYGNINQIEEMPQSSITKKNIVPWNHDQALNLWQKRHADTGEAIPDIFADKDDVIHLPENVIHPNKLILKAKTAEEMMFYTMDDE